MPYTTCVSDTVDAVEPERKEAVDALRHGQITTYDPDDNGGADTSVGLNAGLFNPIVLAPYLALPLRIAPAYEKLLELLVAVLGMALWARRLGMSRGAGLVGGMVYATSGFMVVWTNWPQTSVAAFVPMLFWTLERLAQRRDLSSALLVTLPFTAMLLGGFPVVTGWSAYAGGAYLLMRLIAQRAGFRTVARGLIAAAGAAVVAGGLAAFQLLPFVHTYASQNLGYRTNQALGILPKFTALTALFPQAVGTCRGNVTHTVQNSNIVESSVFIGTVAVVLVVLGLVGRMRSGVPQGIRIFFVVVFLICANQVYVHDAVEREIARLPVFSGNLDARLHFLMGLCAALLATVGFDRLLAGAWRPRWWRHPMSVPVAAVWVAAAAVGVLAAVHARRLAAAAHLGGDLDRDTTVAVVIGMLAVALVLVAAAIPRARTVVAVVVAALVAVQGASYARSFWPREPNAAFYPVTGTDTFLAANLGEDRTAGVALATLPGTDLYYGLRMATGRSFVPADYSDLLRAADPHVFASPTFTSLELSSSVVESPVLDQLSVKYLVAPPQDPAIGTLQPAPVTSGSSPLLSGVPITASAGSLPLRSVGIVLSSALPVGKNALPKLAVTLANAAGAVVSAGSRRLTAATPAGTTVWVNVTDTGTPGPLTAHITLTDPGEQTTIEDAAGGPALTRIAAADDGLRIVYAADSIIYQRLNALPRVRWASQAEALPAAQQVAALTNGLPADDVVLNPGTASTAAGGTATVALHTDQDTHIAATVTAQSAGYLVVGDAALPGWQATVDGHSAPLLTVDHGLQAVAVPAGTHEVSVVYHQQGLVLGVVVTVVFLIGYVAAWGAVLWLHTGRRRRRGVGRGARRGAGRGDRPGARPSVGPGAGPDSDGPAPVTA